MNTGWTRTRTLALENDSDYEIQITLAGCCLSGLAADADFACWWRAGPGWDKVGYCGRCSGGIVSGMDTLDILILIWFSYGCLPKLTSDPVILEAMEASVRVLTDQLDKGYHVYGSSGNYMAT